MRLTREDRLLDDLVRIVMENVRLPNLVLGDINAELAAVRIAERRILENSQVAKPPTASSLLVTTQLE